MANIKSAKKRIKVNEKKAMANKRIKSEVKTLIKKVDAAVVDGDKEVATTKLANATKAIDSACSKKVMSKNTAARRVSKLTKRVNAL